MKIKIDKKVWLVIIIIIFVIAAVSLIRPYTQQVKQRKELSADLAAKQAALRNYTADKEELEDELEAAESLLNTSRAKFPESVESIEYGEDLFEIADDCNVDLTGLDPSASTALKVGAVTYSVSTFAVIVKGDIDDILKFIDAIRIGDGFQLPWSAEVKSVSMGWDVETTATITMEIYGYEG